MDAKHSNIANSRKRAHPHRWNPSTRTRHPVTVDEESGRTQLFANSIAIVNRIASASQCTKWTDDAHDRVTYTNSSCLCVCVWTFMYLYWAISLDCFSSPSSRLERSWPTAAVIIIILSFTYISIYIYIYIPIHHFRT